MVASIGTSNTAVGSNNNSQDQLKNRITLWTQDFIACQPLAPFFHIATLGSLERSGEHIIALQSEREIRLLARTLTGAAKTVSVFVCHDPLELSIHTMGHNAAMMILQQKLSYAEWLNEIKEAPLSLEDAVAIAEDILSSSPHSVERTIELDMLGRRAGVSEYKWSKEYLAVIKAKLEQTLSLSTITQSEIIAIRQEIQEYLTQDLPSSSYEEFKILLRNKHVFISEREIEKLFNECLRAVENEEARGSHLREIENLIQLGDQSLNLFDFLDEDLASPLTLLSKDLNMRPELALTTVLTAASSLHKTQTRLDIRKRQGFLVPGSIYSCMIAESGQKKSPITKALMSNPLAVLQKEKRQEYEEACSKYELEIAQWEKCKGESRQEKFPNGKPQKPRQRLYYFTDTTGEGLLYQYQAHPNNGMLYLVDELAGLFAKRGKYSGGRGSERQDFLSAFDGAGATVLRADGTRADLENVLLSVYGTIQPEVLKQLMQDCSDPDGQWARFLFVNQPLAPSRLPDYAEGTVDLTELLKDLYRRLDNLPAKVYRFSDSAYKRYQKVYDQLEILRASHPSSGMRAVYSKMEGYIGRIALNLHVINSVMAGATPDEFISLDTINKAIELAKFYMGQVKLLHAHSDNEGLAPHIIRLRDASKLAEEVGKDGWIHNRIFYQNLPKKLKEQLKKEGGIEAVRKWMHEAVALGIGQTRGAKAKLEFHWRSDNSSPTPPTPPENFVGDCGRVVGDQPTTESLVNKGVENIVDFVGQNSISPTALLDNEKITNKVMADSSQILEELQNLSTEPTKIETTKQQAIELVDDLPTSRPQNPQLLLTTTQTILGIIATHTQPYFKWEDDVNVAVELLPLTENWSEVQEIISGLELDKAQQQEVERRLTQLGHCGKLHALSSKTQVTQSESESEEKVAKAERRFRNGDRVRYQQWYGRFGGYVKSGCLVEFDKSKSTTKLYGSAPTQPIAESDLVLVEKAT
jgi:hypothetical protein